MDHSFRYFLQGSLANNGDTKIFSRRDNDTQDRLGVVGLGESNGDSADIADIGDISAVEVKSKVQLTQNFLGRL
jgi:hypothetical protein